MRCASFLGLTLIVPLLLSCAGDDDGAAGSGFLEAREVTVSAEAAGRVVDLRFDEGTVIRRGDTLLVIDPSRLKLEMASASAGRAVAEVELEAAHLQLQAAKETEAYARSERERVDKLLESGTATPKLLDQLEFEHTQAVLAMKTAEVRVRSLTAQVEQIDADINRLLRQLEDCHPTAAVGGIVTEKHVDLGELLAPGRPMARIASLDTLWVKVYLPAGRFAGVKISDPATVDTESGGKKYQGTVIWTSREAEFTPKNVQTEESRASLVYAVKVQVPNTGGELKIGMPVFVSIDQR